MKPNEIYFCVIHDPENGNEIFFCPIDYWNENQCLPDYSWADEIETIPPDDYSWILFREEVCWSSNKDQFSIVKDLVGLSFVEGKALEKFLLDLKD